VITHVAIKDANGLVWSLAAPSRHHNVIHLMHKKLGWDLAKKGLRTHKQGFLNHQGQFLTREAAWVEAFRCNQILPPYNPINPKERRWDLPVGVKQGELFSEDLW